MSYQQKLGQLRNELGELNKLVPEACKGFGALQSGATDNGVLDHKTKELIELGISIAVRCEPCILFHVEALRKTGATREELGDVISMAIVMGGGPSMMYGSKALAAWDDLSA